MSIYFRIILSAAALVLLWQGPSFGKDRVYATEEEVLEMAFPGAEFAKKTVKISDEDKARVESLTGGKYFKKRVTFHIATIKGELAGYAIKVNEKGKKKNITFMVIIDGAGTVKSVDLLVFRESQGYEIENPRWRKQFEGKTLKDPLKPKRDIDNISGATLSVRAVTKGVKGALAVFSVMRPLLDD